MTNSIIQLLIPIIAFSLLVLIQILICRFSAKANLLRSLVLSTITGVLICLIMEIINYLIVYNSFINTISYSILNSIIVLALSYCYFHFLNLGETARRIRIIREISESENGLTLNQILSRYNADEIVERRLNRLLNKKQIKEKDDNYYINNKLMLIMSKIIITMKFIVLGKRSEFD